jgi:hypothetical protein
MVWWVVGVEVELCGWGMCSSKVLHVTRNEVSIYVWVYDNAMETRSETHWVMNSAVWCA